jgi:hypothetical protein
VLIQTKPYKIYGHAYAKLDRWRRLLRAFSAVLAVLFIALTVWSYRLGAGAVAFAPLLVILMFVGMSIFKSPLKSLQLEKLKDLEGSIEFTDEYAWARISDGTESKLTWPNFNKVKIQSDNVVFFHRGYPCFNIPEDAFVKPEVRNELLGFLESKGLMKRKR